MANVEMAQPVMVVPLASGRSAGAGMAFLESVGTFLVVRGSQGMAETLWLALALWEMAATALVVPVKEETKLVVLGSMVMAGTMLVVLGSLVMVEMVSVVPAALEMKGMERVVPGSGEKAATSLVVWALPEMLVTVLVAPG
jgi:hypothetical protein